MIISGVTQQNKSRQIWRKDTPSASAEELNISFSTSDDLQSRVAVELGRFRDWAGEDEKLWLGEFGIPNDKGGSQQEDWNDILTLMVDKCICDNIAFSYWATGHAWGTYNLEPYTGVSTSPGTDWEDNAISETFDAALAKADGHVPFVGVNYAGHEFGESEQDPNAAPDVEDFEFMLERGNKVLRYPLGEPSWTSNWLYIPATDAWRDSDIQHVERVLNRAADAGVKIILDILHPGGGAKYATIGGAHIGNATNYGYYVAYAKKLLNHSFDDHNSNTVLLKNHSALYGIDMVNEPQTLGSGSGNSWLGISQDLVDDFRDEDKINYQGTLFVALPHYSGIQDVESNCPDGPWITDSEDNYYYAGHLYPETSHVGTFTGSYSDNVTSSSSFSGQGGFSCTV